MQATISPTSERPRRRRVGPVLGLVIALLAAPAVVLASHQFTDVPNSNPFHEQISRLVESGITTGCTATTYCPKNAVTREQMAAFLTRGLGNSVASYNELPIEDWATTYVADLTIRAGGTTGGTGFITIAGDVSVIVFEPLLCPCGIEIGIDQLDAPGTSPQMLFTVTDEELDGIRANAGAVEWVFEVPSGVDASFGLYANVFTQPIVTGGASTEGVPVSAGVLLGSMTAEYSPFGSTQVSGPAVSGVDVDGTFGRREPARTEQSVPR
jgi:hypothetical protein